MIPGSPQDAAKTLEALSPYLRAHHYEPGQVLWLEGEVSGRLVVIDSGRVKVVRVLSDGTSLLLYVLSEGDIFGFLPFVDGGAYPATAIAVEAVDARVMSRSRLRAVLAEDHQVALVLLRELSTRLRQAFRRLGDQTQRSSRTRVAAALALLLPKAVTTNAIIDLPQPLHSFAADVGMTPETFARSVTLLVKEGVVHRLSKAQLQVLDAAALHHIAAGSLDAS